MSRTMRAANAGFTLVEVLLALAIGAVMMTTVFSSLDTALRTRQAVADHSTPYAVGPAILDAVEADLRNAHFYDVKENDAFWGADGDLYGREADGLSFLTATLCQVGEPELKSQVFPGRENEIERRSPTTEVQYVCRRSVSYPGSLELWRREDFYVDDLQHDGGIYRLVYDRVYEFKLEYVRRSSGAAGAFGGADKGPEQMRQDGWNAIEEKDVPRGVVATIAIYARESEEQSRLREEPQVFVFRRWIPLPQVHEGGKGWSDVCNYPGILKEKTATAGAGAAGARARQNRGGGREGGRSTTLGDRSGGGDAFQQALNNRGNRGGARGGGQNVNIGSIFMPQGG